MGMRDELHAVPRVRDPVRRCGSVASAGNEMTGSSGRKVELGGPAGVMDAADSTGTKVKARRCV